MVQDVYSKADVLNTTASYGAPNFRQVKGSYPLYGMGQPSLNGFKHVLQRLQAQGHEVTAIIINVFVLAEYENRPLLSRHKCFSGLIFFFFPAPVPVQLLPGLLLSVLSVNI